MTTSSDLRTTARPRSRVTAGEFGQRGPEHDSLHSGAEAPAVELPGRQLLKQFGKETAFPVMPPPRERLPRPDAPQQRQFISPAVLLGVLLCFFLPFFSVSCTSGVVQMKATVTGIDQVVGGKPEYSGFRPTPTSEDATAADQEQSQVSPSALIGFVAIIIGVGLGLGLRKPKARWVSGAVASGIALVAVVINQVMIHRRAQEALDQAASSFRDQLGDSPIFGQSVPVPAFELGDEPGFWVVTGLLGLVVAYNVFEVVVLQRRPNQLPRSAADGAGAPQPAAFPPTNGSAPGWGQGPPTRPQDPRPLQAAHREPTSYPPVVPPPVHQAPAGWYRDPGGQPCSRWWDGYEWTQRTAPLA